MSRWLAYFASLTLTVSENVRAGELAKVFIPPVKGQHVSKDALSTLFDFVVVAVGRANVLRVVTINDVNTMLGQEKLKDALGCNSISCATELGGALGARFLLATHAKRLGGELIFTASLIDTKEQESKHGLARCRDKSGEYGQAVDAAIAEALGLVTVRLSSAARAVPGTASSPDEVQQAGTDLYWLRCPVGGNWRQDRCEYARAFAWDAAQTACPPDYRVPTIEEYEFLLGSCSRIFNTCHACNDSPACRGMFVNEEGLFWTSSSVAKASTDTAIAVDLMAGRTVEEPRTGLYPVQCVRGSLSGPDTHGGRPSTRARSPSSSSTAAAEAPVISSELTPDDIKAGVEANMNNLDTCISAAAVADSFPIAKPFILMADWTIKPDGSVVDGALKGPLYALSTSMPACFAVKMKAWKFRASPSGAPVRGYPLGPYRIP